jgi:hypothetical protein
MALTLKIISPTLRMPLNVSNALQVKTETLEMVDPLQFISYSGKYCTNGGVSGDCAAGFWCKLGSPTAWPNDTLEIYGVICPLGYYCESGTVTIIFRIAIHCYLGYRIVLSGTVAPQSCPLGRVINFEGAASVAECDHCPAGYECPVGVVVPQPCRPGWYCPFNETRTMCPLYTYNNLSGGQSLLDCLPCPPGYFCNEEGMAMYQVNPCPPGYYCTQATYSPVPCPEGTYRSDEGAGNITDCWPCPAGYYCVGYNQTTNGTQCERGEFCPEGTQVPMTCQPGMYNFGGKCGGKYCTSVLQDITAT